LRAETVEKRLSNSVQQKKTQKSRIDSRKRKGRGVAVVQCPSLSPDDDRRAVAVALDIVIAARAEHERGMGRVRHREADARRLAEAYAELAMVQVQFLFGGPYSPHQIIPKAEAAARKALELDGNLARARRALGQILNLYYWRWEEGDKELERATVLGGLDDPPEAISASLRRRGRYQEAIAAAERGRTFDPLSVQAQIAVGNSYRAARQYDRAMLLAGTVSSQQDQGMIAGRIADPTGAVVVGVTHWKITSCQQEPRAGPRRARDYQAVTCPRIS
jgi:tetratricopeptide (TPR) repeat protein